MADAEEKTKQKFIARMGAILCSCRHRIFVPGEYSSLDFPRVRDRTFVGGRRKASKRFMADAERVPLPEPWFFYPMPTLIRFM